MEPLVVQPSSPCVPIPVSQQPSRAEIAQIAIGVLGIALACLIFGIGLSKVTGVYLESQLKWLRALPAFPANTRGMDNDRICMEDIE